MHKKTAFLCLGSTPGPITDTFKSIHRASEKNEHFFFIGTKISIDLKLLSKRSLLIQYKRNIFGFLYVIYNIKKILFFLRNNDIEKLFIFSTFPITGIISLLAPRRISIYWWLHDPVPHSGEKILNIFIKKIDEFLIFKSSKVKKIFVASNYLINNLPENYKKDKFTVVKFPFVSEIVNANEISNNSDCHVYDIVFFGRVEPYKGLDWFLSGIEFFGDFLKEKKILIAGKGNIKYDYKKLLNDGFFIIQDNQYIDNDLLKKYISKAKVCIFPYRDSTGTQALQTAGALGALIVATDVGSFSESSVKKYTFLSNKDNKKDFFENIKKALSSNIPRDEICNSYKNEFSEIIFIENLINEININD